MTETTPNLRDVGDLVTYDGRVVQRHRILRSAAPLAGDVGPAGIQWPPAVVIDLRSSAELEDAHPLEAAGARIVNLPLLSALRPGAAPPESLDSLYLLMLQVASDHLIDLVAEVAAAPGATLIHCAAGKDRTGVSVALLLRLVGVSRDDVMADYLLTAAAEDEISARLEQMAGHGHRATLPPAFYAVAPDALHGVLDVWDAHSEGVEGWFVEIGGTRDVVEQLRRTLLT